MKLFKSLSPMQKSILSFSFVALGCVILGENNIATFKASLLAGFVPLILGAYG